MRVSWMAFVLSVGASVALGAESASSVPGARGREWAVSICAPYLGGLGADEVWSAGRSVGIFRMEVYLDENLACPHLYEKDGRPYRIDTPDARRVLREKLAKEGFSIGCLAMVTKLAADGSDDEAVLRRVRRAAEAAPELGRPVIMLPIGITATAGQKLTDEAFVSRGRAFVRGLDRIAAETGAQIVLENLGHFWNRPEILEPVLKESTPDRVGLLLDITNMYWYGHPLDRLYELARQFAPYVRYLHLKNIRYPEDQRQRQRTPGWEYGKYAEPIRTGDVDFVRILRTLTQAGYVGDLTIEDDSLPHFDVHGKKKALIDDVAFLRLLIRRYPRVTGDCGHVESYRLDGSVLHLKCSGGWVRLTACDPAVIRLEAAASEGARPEYQAVDVRQIAPTPVTVQEFPDHIDFATGKLICQVDKRPFRVTYYWSDPKGWLTRPAPGPAIEWTAEGPRTRLLLTDRERERVYGLGLNFHGFDRRGRFCEIKTNADPHWDNGHSHVVAPFFMTTWGYGVFLNNTGYSTFNVDEDGDNLVTITAPGAVLDWYYIHGGSLRDVFARYRVIVGRSEMPARWGLGLWYRAETKWKQAQVQAAAEEFRRRQIPCDVIGLEPGWQSHAYSCSYVWDNENYPDPAALLKWLGERHFRLNLWTHAYVHPSSPLHPELTEKRCAGDRRVWEGLVPDFTLPRTREVFDRGFVAGQVEAGVSGYKLDECDGSDNTGGWFFPDDTRFPSGLTGARMHNIFGALYQDAFHEMFRARNRRTYFLCRANFATGVRRPTVAYSDLYDLREYLRAQANAGLIGALWCPEVRQTDTAADFIRRSQLMFFSPLAQLDGWNSGVLPWEKGPEAEEIFRRYAVLRMQMLPYLYGLFWQMRNTGVPMLRPLVMDNREDRNTFDVDDQFMLGDSMMVAPLVSGTQREAYFPYGRWTNLLTGETVRGGVRRSIPAPLDQIPVYLRDGAVLPLGAGGQHADEAAAGPMVVRIFCGQSGRFDVFEDDGVTCAYEQGRCAVTPLVYREHLNHREVRIGPAKGSYPGLAPARDYLVVLHHAPAVQGIQLNGKPFMRLSDGEAAGGVAGWYSDPDGTLVCRLEKVTAVEGAVLTIRTDNITAGADGFQPMFNGRDLTGWQIMGRNGDWHVDSGEVVCTGKSGEFLDWIRSAEEYEDFILRLEFNMSERCNRGVFVRTKETGRQSRTGMEIQIEDDAGKPPTRTSSGSVYDVVPPRVNAIRRAGEWNDLEIACIGRQLKVTLNGSVIHDLNLDDPAVSADVPDGRKLSQRARRGYVGLQNHRCPIRFRNVWIKVLK